MIAEYDTTNRNTYDWPLTITANDWWYPTLNPVEHEDNSPKAVRRRFQEYTRSLCREAPFHGIRPAARQGTVKQGARAREQRDRKTI